MSKALDELLAGHSRAIATGKARPQAGPRLPTAAVLACTDERVVPQFVFDHPPGKIYMVRMAGNVYTPEVAGSLELAVVRLGCPLILVLGHTDCTAVEIARTNPRVEGRTYEVTRRIRYALDGIPSEAPMARAVEANVRYALKELRERDRIFREREEEGLLEMAGAVYELETGRVRLL
jgi:carbonic anhydrase